MKRMAWIIAVFGLMALSGRAETSTNKSTTLKGMPAGMAGCYSTQKAKVDKVFAAHQDGARFRAYQIKWMNQDVIISDMMASTDFKEGDEITFMVQSIEMPVGKESVKMLQFMLMDFGKFMPKEEPAAPDEASP